MWSRRLPRPSDCPICGAPFSTCTTFHSGQLTTTVSMPRSLRAQLLAKKQAAAAREPDAVTSPPFTTATYERVTHNPRVLARRRQKDKKKL